MRIAVIPNSSRAEAERCTQKVLAVLKGCGCEILLKPYCYHDGGCVEEMLADPELALCALILAVGGDGTIIHVAKIAAALDKPILGINAGKLGFTAVVEQEELSLLPRLLTGYQEEKRLMLQVEVQGKRGRVLRHALNDAVVSAELAKIIDYRLALGDGESYKYRADGFIVSTPTGSTAYSLSAGGPVVDPSLDSIIYTPICPHSLFNRSVLFGAGTRLQVEIPENRSRLYLTIDGEGPVELRAGDRLAFSQSPRRARFIKLTNKNFYDILNQKLVN